MDYSLTPGVNFSRLKHISRSPLHFHAQLQAEHRDSPAMRLGRAVHAATLTPETWRPVVVERLTDGQRAALEVLRTSVGMPAIYEGAVRRGKAWDAFEAAHHGPILLASEYEAVKGLVGATDILTHREMETASCIRDAVRANPHAMALLRWAQTEVPRAWTYEGIACKGRVDILLPGKSVWDLKTAADIHPDRFRWDALKRMYHVQLAWYAHGCDVPEAGIIAVESHEPWDVGVYRLSSMDMMHGRLAWVAWMDRLRECMAADTWPGQVPEPRDLDVPAKVDDAGLDWEEET
jgi:hypothetical protein